MFNSLVDFLHRTRIVKGRESHVKARLVVCLILLLASAIGVLITDFVPHLAWVYWIYAIPTFCVICIILAWIVSRHHSVSGITVWHEILHWIGLLCAVYIVSLVVSSGIISYLIGGMFILILLALAMFLAGVHFDSMYIIIGIILGILAVVETLLVKYLTFILIPIIIVVAILVYWRYSHHKKRARNERPEKSLKNDVTDADDEL